VVEELLQQQLKLKDLVFDVLVVEEEVIQHRLHHHHHQIPMSGVLLFGQLFILQLSSRQRRVNVMCGSIC
jgi:hypothetical protein